MTSLQQNLRQFCSSNGLRLNTNLGQHFLIDEEILHSIVEAGAMEPRDHIVEIGPGVGVLTKQLLANANKVTAIEIDERMPPLIEQYVDSEHLEKLEVINQNALEAKMPDSPYKIIANIPYHITSPLLRHVYLESSPIPSSLTLLIQKEVAERICNQDDASLLTIIVGLFGTPKLVCTVPPSAFLPPPKVDSAVIHIASHTSPIADPETIEQVMKLAKIGFSQKRKMLKNSFGTFPGGLELLKRAGIEETRRPQTLSIEEWILVAKAAA